MKIKFNSFQDRCRLQNLLLFAGHKNEEIAAMREISVARAEQMVEENRQWEAMGQRLHTKDLIEVEI